MPFIYKGDCCFPVDLARLDLKLMRSCPHYGASLPRFSPLGGRFVGHGPAQMPKKLFYLLVVPCIATCPIYIVERLPGSQELHPNHFQSRTREYEVVPGLLSSSTGARGGAYYVVSQTWYAPMLSASVYTVSHVPTASEEHT